tara:strand:- start:5694 stop:6962 length:1269 start_codon:yes stop_codon:yes gene_type:complete
MISRYFVYLAHLISLLMLSRAFTPLEFGVVASLTVVFIFFKMVTEGGFGPAIINLRDLSDEDKNGIFSVSLLFGIACSIIFYLLTPTIIEFYGIQDIYMISPYVCVSIFIYSITIVPNSFLLRELKFKELAIAGGASEIIGLLVALISKDSINPIVALSLKLLATNVALATLTLFYSSKTQFGVPSIGTKLSAITPLMSFISYQFLFNIVNYFSRSLDAIIVGKYFGAPMLALYDKSYQIMKYPLMLLTFAMTPAIQPVIKGKIENPEEVIAIHDKFISRLSFLAIIIGGIVCTYSELIVHILLGEQWGNVSGILSILSLSIPLQIILSTSGSFYQSFNQSKLLFLSGCFSLSLVIVSVLIGIIYNDVYVLCYMLVASYHVSFLQNYCLLYIRVFNKNPTGFLIRALPIFIFAPVAIFFRCF